MTTLIDEYPVGDGIYDKNGFFFRQRRGHVNLRKLESIDMHRLIREVDVDLLQQYIEDLTFCKFGEQDLQFYSDKQVIKLFNLAQLTIEYLLYSQERLVNSLNDLSKKYSTKKRTLHSKRKEYNALKEESNSLHNQLKAKRRNLSTLEKMIRDSEGLRNQQESQSLSQRKKEYLRFYITFPNGIYIEMEESRHLLVRELISLIRNALVTTTATDSRQTSSNEDKQTQPLDDIIQALSDRNVRLFLKGVLLLQEHSLDACRVAEGDTILVVVQQTGGAKTLPPPTVAPAIVPGPAPVIVAPASSENDAAMQALMAVVQQQVRGIHDLIDEMKKGPAQPVNNNNNDLRDLLAKLLEAQQAANQQQPSTTSIAAPSANPRLILGDLEADNADDNALLLQEIQLKLLSSFQRIGSLDNSMNRTSLSMDEMKALLLQQQEQLGDLMGTLQEHVRLPHQSTTVLTNAAPVNNHSLTIINQPAVNTSTTTTLISPAPTPMAASAPTTTLRTPSIKLATPTSSALATPKPTPILKHIAAMKPIVEQAEEAIIMPQPVGEEEPEELLAPVPAPTAAEPEMMMMALPQMEIAAPMTTITFPAQYHTTTSTVVGLQRNPGTLLSSPLSTGSLGIAADTAETIDILPPSVVGQEVTMSLPDDLAAEDLIFLVRSNAGKQCKLPFKTVALCLLPPPRSVLAADTVAAAVIIVKTAYDLPSSAIAYLPSGFKNNDPTDAFTTASFAALARSGQLRLCFESNHLVTNAKIDTLFAPQYQLERQRQQEQLELSRSKSGVGMMSRSASKVTTRSNSAATGSRGPVKYAAPYYRNYDDDDDMEDDAEEGGEKKAKQDAKEEDEDDIYFTVPKSKLSPSPSPAAGPSAAASTLPLGSSKASKGPVAGEAAEGDAATDYQRISYKTVRTSFDHLLSDLTSRRSLTDEELQAKRKELEAASSASDSETTTQIRRSLSKALGQANLLENAATDRHRDDYLYQQLLQGQQQQQMTLLRASSTGGVGGNMKEEKAIPPPSSLRESREEWRSFLRQSTTTSFLHDEEEDEDQGEEQDEKQQPAEVDRARQMKAIVPAVDYLRLSTTSITAANKDKNSADGAPPLSSSSLQRVDSSQSQSGSQRRRRNYDEDEEEDYYGNGNSYRTAYDDDTPMLSSLNRPLYGTSNSSYLAAAAAADHSYSTPQEELYDDHHQALYSSQGNNNNASAASFISSVSESSSKRIERLSSAYGFNLGGGAGSGSNNNNNQNLFSTPAAGGAGRGGGGNSNVSSGIRDSSQPIARDAVNPFQITTSTINSSSAPPTAASQHRPQTTTTGASMNNMSSTNHSSQYTNNSRLFDLSSTMDGSEEDDQHQHQQQQSNQVSSFLNETTTSNNSAIQRAADRYEGQDEDDVSLLMSMAGGGGAGGGRKPHLPTGGGTAAAGGKGHNHLPEEDEDMLDESSDLMGISKGSSEYSPFKDFKGRYEDNNNSNNHTMMGGDTLVSTLTGPFLLGEEKRSGGGDRNVGGGAGGGGGRSDSKGQGQNVLHSYSSTLSTKAGSSSLQGGDGNNRKAMPLGSTSSSHRTEEKEELMDTMSTHSLAVSATSD